MPFSILQAVLARSEVTNTPRNDKLVTKNTVEYFIAWWLLQDNITNDNPTAQNLCEGDPLASSVHRPQHACLKERVSSFLPVSFMLNVHKQ